MIEVKNITEDELNHYDGKISHSVGHTVSTSSKCSRFKKSKDDGGEVLLSHNITAEIQKDKVANCHWYVIRCTYGREKKAFDFLKKQGFEAFYPVITSTASSNDGSKKVVECRLSNILFVYGTFEQLKFYIYNNVSSDTSYLRFYYNQFVDGTKSPVTIPNSQMDSLMKICSVQAEDKLIDPNVVEKFKKGKLVKVIEGPYKGVEGVVGRYKGQQRIGIVVEDLFTVTTSYVPKDFINYEEDFY